MNLRSQWQNTTAVAVGATALAFTVACNGTPPVTGVAAQQPVPQAGAPVVVGCEPHQRTLVRPTVVNGTAMSQVECVSAAPVGSVPVQPEASAPVVAQTAVPVTYAPAPARRVSQPVYTTLPDAEVVQVSNAPRPVRTQQVVYERPEKRSVKKSAVIIGSSAGVGAGVGAAMGGKKGALIGAAIGGGGAAVWDQITRRQ